MAPANNSLRPSIPSLAAIEHRRRELLAWRAAQRASPGEPLDDPPGGENPYLEEDRQLAENLQPSGPSAEAPKMPAGGINAHNALNAHPPQRKSGHFTPPRASTRSLCRRARLHVGNRESKIRGHVGLFALLRLARQSPYALAAASKKTSGAFQLIATSLTEYASWSSSHMRIGGRRGKVCATLSAGRALGPPERSPGHGAGISSAMLGRWCGCRKGFVPAWVTHETPKQFRPNT